MSPFSNATYFPIYTIHYVKSSCICRKKSTDEQRRGEASGTAQPAGVGSWSRKQRGQVAHHQDVIYCHSSVTKIKHNQALIKMGLDCSTRKPPDPSHDNGGKRMKGNFPLAQFFTANWATSNKRTPSPNKEHPHGFNARYLL